MIKDELYEIVDWLNDEYNQQSEKYSIFLGPKPEVIRYANHIAISLWACGAIVCICDQLFFIREDDGHWWANETNDGYIGFQMCFSIGWVNSFINALSELNKYVEQHGTPVYYSGTTDICHYKLGE